jgi:hypothetical protein
MARLTRPSAVQRLLHSGPLRGKPRSRGRLHHTWLAAVRGSFRPFRGSGLFPRPDHSLRIRPDPLSPIEPIPDGAGACGACRLEDAVRDRYHRLLTDAITTKGSSPRCLAPLSPFRIGGRSREHTVEETAPRSAVRTRHSSRRVHSGGPKTGSPHIHCTTGGEGSDRSPAGLSEGRGCGSPHLHILQSADKEIRNHAGGRA